MRRVATGLHLGFPTALRGLADLLQPVRLSFRLNTATCSGTCQITLTNDGRVHYTGRVHNSGALSARYTVITSLPVPVLPRGALLIARQGHVGGTFSFDSRDESWNVSSVLAHVANHWAAVKEAAPSARTDFGTGTGFTEVIDGLVNAATGTFLLSL